MKRLRASGFELPSPPKRTPVAEPDAKRFTEDARPARPTRQRAASAGEPIKVYLPPELAEELRVRCAQERRSLSNAITSAVEAWIHGRKRKGR